MKEQGTMTFAERLLYHQIHPFKIATDSSGGTLALFWLWRHDALVGVATAALPSLISSALVMAFIDLRPYQRSTAGRYLSRYISPLDQAVRLAGYVVMMAGAWLHSAGLLLAGLVVVLFCWFYGLYDLAR